MSEILVMIFVYFIAVIISFYFALPLGAISIIIGVPILKKIFLKNDEKYHNAQLLVWIIGNILILDNEYSFFWQEYGRSFIFNSWKDFVVFFHKYITNNDYLFLVIINGSIYILDFIKNFFLTINFKFGRYMIDVIQTVLIYFIMQFEIIFWACFGSRIYKKVRRIANFE